MCYDLLFSERSKKTVQSIETTFETSNKMPKDEIKYIPPEYKITDKVLNLVVEGEKMLKDIFQADLSATSVGGLVEEAIVENLYSLSRLIRADITRGEAKKIAVGKIPVGKQFRVISNYRSVMEYIRNTCTSGLGEFNYNVVMHLNKLLGEGVTDEWDIGRARAQGDLVSDKFEPFQPKKIDSGLVAKTLPQLISYIETTLDVHPLLRAVVMLSDFTQLYPFVHLNSVTVFACFDLFLNIKGVAGEGMVPVWKITSEDTDMFLTLFEEVSSTGKRFEDLLEYVVVGWHKAIENVRREVVKLSYNEEIKGKAKFLNLNHRQLAALRFLQTHVKVSRLEYMKLFKVSTMTAYRDLNDMLEKKLLTIHGQGRGTYYILFTKS